MRLATITRTARLHRLKACSGHGVGQAGRRYLTMLHPPKFENEKMVRGVSLDWVVHTDALKAQLCQRLLRESRAHQNNPKAQGTISCHHSH